MAFVLNQSQFTKGLQRQSLLLLSTLQYIATLPQFTVQDFKALLEVDQTQEFEDSEFKAFILEIFSLDLDYEQLQANEIALLNELRAYANPSPGISCCGSDTPKEENTEPQFVKRTVSTSFQYEARVLCNSDVTCDVNCISMHIEPIGDAPQPSGNDHILKTLGCRGDKQVFSKLWLDFVGNPSEGSYNITYKFLNEFGGVLAEYANTVKF